MHNLARSKALSSLDVRSKSGDTLLGWVLRYVLSGCLSIEDGLSLVQRLLALGISASTPAFSENVPPLALATAIGNRELWEMISKVSEGCTCLRHLVTDWSKTIRSWWQERLVCTSAEEHNNISGEAVSLHTTILLDVVGKEK
eukprot:1160938-Pelagomonas_calceolata.AAC.21